jgi:cupin fold WbuC family metalloprotein
MKKHIHASDLAELARGAESSQRARTHLNTHDSTDADVQRLFIATMPGTYIRPHRHSEAHKWEFFLLLEGSMDLLIFAEDGRLIERTRLSRADTRAVEIPPGTWHSYVCCEAGTIALEVKQGAYLPTTNEDFAPWSPAENSDSSNRFLAWMRDAPIGSTPLGGSNSSKD